MRGFGSVTTFRDGYRARIWVAGRRHERTFPQKGLAERWLAGMVAHKVDVLSHREHPRGTRHDVTFADVAEEALESLIARRTFTNRTAATYRYELKELLDYWGKRRVAAVRDRDVDAWVRKLREAGYSTSSVRHYLDRLSQTLKHCQREGYIGQVQVRIERPRMVQRTIREGLGPAELERLEEAAEQDYDLRVPVAVLLASRAGLRAAEICQLRPEDVYASRGYLRVEVRGERSDRTKSGLGRTVPLTDPSLLSALKRLPCERGKPLLGLRTGDGLRSLLARAWRKARLPGAPQPHRLRHTYATNEVLAGTPLPVIQRRLGHRTILTTMRYVHVHETVADGVQVRVTSRYTPKKRVKPK